MHVHYSCRIDSPTIVAEVTEVRPASPPPTPHLRSLVATSHLHFDTMISLEAYEHDTKVPSENKACLMIGLDQLEMIEREVPGECGPWE